MKAPPVQRARPGRHPATAQPRLRVARTARERPLEALHLPALAGERALERVGGGSETDVYHLPGSRFVFKVKGMGGGSLATVLAEARASREAAAHFSAYLGAAHTLPTDWFVARDGGGALRLVARQPFLRQAVPLASVGVGSLSPAAQLAIEAQLLALLRRSLRCYHRTGQMPDLYGTVSRSRSERRRLNTPLHWPRRVARFFTQRLWHSQNLLLDGERVVLVDYDRVRWRGAWGQLYYAICWLLFVRDFVHLAWRQRSAARGPRPVVTAPLRRGAGYAFP